MPSYPLSPQEPPLRLISKEGAPLSLISSTEFHREERHKLTPPRLHEEEIYQAHATSLQLEEEKLALSFDVVLHRIYPIEGALAGIGFRLILLDQDFHHVSTHLAELWSDGRWHIPAPHTPIYVCRGTARSLFDKVKTGYLLDNPDTTLRDLAAAPRYESTDLYDRLKDESGFTE